jgi:hypothetical protein
MARANTSNINQRAEIPNYIDAESKPQNRVDRALETPGFLQFLSEFPDSENLEMGEGDEAEILRRFEAYENIPKVTKVVTEVLKQRVFEGFAGLEISDAELLAVGQYLREQITQEENYELLERLAKQVSDYKRLPGEIKDLELELLTMQDRQTVATNVLEAEMRMQEIEDEQASLRKTGEGMEAVKKAVAITGEIKKLVGEMGSETIKEEQEVFKHIDEIILSWQDRQARLSEVAAEIPQVDGLAKNPELESFAALWKHQKSQQTDRTAFIRSFKRMDWQNRLETFVGSQQHRLLRAEKKLSELNERRKKQNPKFEEGARAVSQILEDSKKKDRVDTALFQSHSEMLGLENNLTEISVVNEELSKEPWNYELLQRLKKLSVEVSAVRQVGPKARQLEINVEQLVAIADRHDFSQDTHNWNKVVEHSEKSFIKRLFGDPLKKIDSKMNRLEIEKSMLELKHEAAFGELGQIDDLVARKKQLERNKKKTDEELFNTLGFAKDVFRLAREKTIQKLENLSDPNASPDQFVEAEKLLAKLEQSQEENPDLDIFGEDFLVKRYTRDTLKQGLGKLLLDRVAKEVKKLISGVDEKNVKATDIYKKIMELQGGMGAFGASERYKQVKINAIKEVLKDSSVPWVKRAVLKRALYREDSEGNFWSFLHPNAQAQATT